MRRRLILVGILALTLAACGGSSSTPPPSASDQGSLAPSGDAGSSVGPLDTLQPTEAPSIAEPAAGSTATAICDSVILRKAASSSSTRLKTINSGMAVHVVATVSGTSYTAGSCGVSGNTWLQIDTVGGKSAQSAYGVPYVYAAAGFFQ